MEQARRIRMPCASHAERAHAQEKAVHMCMQAISTESITFCVPDACKTPDVRRSR